MGHPRVAIVMGSNSDSEIMEEAAKVLRDLKVPFEIGIYSAHRTPERSAQFATEAASRGIEVIGHHTLELPGYNEVTASAQPIKFNNAFTGRCISNWVYSVLPL
jgi:phosphoribosylaminoimidazole carboxylase PurE protein